MLNSTTAATISSVTSKAMNQKHKRVTRNNINQSAFTNLPNADDIAKSIPEHASSILHIFDRRIDLDSLPSDASLYSLLRLWVMDDPYRFQQPLGSRLLDHASVPSKRRRVNTTFDDTSVNDNKDSNINSDSDNIISKNVGQQRQEDGNGQKEVKEAGVNSNSKQKVETNTVSMKSMDVVSVVKQMNNTETTFKNEQNLMSMVKTSSKEENNEANNDKKCMLAEYILKAKKKKLEAKRRRDKKAIKCKKRLEQLGIHI